MLFAWFGRDRSSSSLFGKVVNVRKSKPPQRCKSDDSWWQLMTVDDSWWQLMTVDDSWWQTMTDDKMKSVVNWDSRFLLLIKRSELVRKHGETNGNEKRTFTVSTVTPEGLLWFQSSESIVEFVDLHRVAAVSFGWWTSTLLSSFVRSHSLDK